MIKMFERELTLICGISGMGKSYLTKRKVIPALIKYTPVIIFDKNREYAGADSKDVPKKWDNFESIDAFLKHILSNGKRLENKPYVIACKTNEDYKKGIAFCYGLPSKVAVLLDESHFIFGEKELAQTKNQLKNLARFGRHEGKSLILISQRTMDVPPDIRSQFLGAITFKQTHKDDIKALDERGWLEAEKVLDLEKKQYKIMGELGEALSKVL